MSGRVLPMLDDPDVRMMAERHHDPEEVWNVAGDLISLHCGMCYQTWPCETAQALKNTPITRSGHGS